jgi:hypothetical protein
MLKYLVVLAGTDPLVWRRIKVPARYSFWDLHVAIQDAMGWEDYHLHEFRVIDPEAWFTVRLGIPDPDYPEDRPLTADWEAFPIDFIRSSPAPIQYIYDFGDNWQHAVIFEEYVHQADEDMVPECLGGGGACPPEDCGGTHGYADLLESLSDPKHPDHGEFLAWTGGPIDPREFSPEAVQFDDPKMRWRIAFEEGAD